MVTYEMPFWHSQNCASGSNLPGLPRKSSGILKNHVDNYTKFNQGTLDKGFKTSETSIRAQVVCNKHQKLIKNSNLGF